MGIELANGHAMALLEGLRVVLILQAAGGCLLCVIGIRTAWKDVNSARAGNGGRKMASETRRSVAVLLLFVFVLILAQALFYMAASDTLLATGVLTIPALKGRVLFNVLTFLLLLMKSTMFRGRRRLDKYYDDMAAGDVLAKKGLYTHKRGTDHDDH